MYQSDTWRGVKHTDPAEEAAYISRSIETYLRTVAQDHSYRVRFAAFDGVARTYVGRGRVELNPNLIAGKPAPFDAAVVDCLCGVAAHEAGHVLIATARGGRFNATNRLRHRAHNIVEDMLIDGPWFAGYNPALGALTEAFRLDGQHDGQRRALVKAAGKPSLSPGELLGVWGCARLFRQPVTFASPAAARAVAELDAAVAPLWAPWRFPYTYDGSIAASVAQRVDMIAQEVWEIIDLYEPDEVPEQPEEDDDEDDEEGDEPTEGGVPTDGEPTDDEPGDDEGDAEDEDEDAEGDDDGSEKPDSEPETPEPGEEPGDDEGGSDGDDSDDDYDFDKDTCPNEGETTDGDLADRIREVDDEIDARDMLEDPLGSLADALGEYLDTRVASEINRVYQRVTHDPARSRHEDAGRIDRRRLPYAGISRNIYKGWHDRQTGGTLVLLLDVSGSTEPYTDDLRRIAAATVYGLSQTPVQVYGYAYDDKVWRWAAPGAVAQLAAIESGGSTGTHNAIRRVVRDVQPSGPSVILHVTDGSPDSLDVTNAAIAEAQEAGWAVVNVGVGNGAEHSEILPEIRPVESYEDVPTVIAGAVQTILRGG